MVIVGAVFTWNNVPCNMLIATYIVVIAMYISIFSQVSFAAIVPIGGGGSSSPYLISSNMTQACSISTLETAVRGSGLLSFIDFSQPYSTYTYTNSSYPGIKVVEITQKHVYYTSLGSYASNYQVEVMCAEKSQLLSLKDKLKSYASKVSVGGAVSTLAGTLSLSNLASLVKIAGCPQLAIVGLTSLDIGQQYNIMSDQLDYVIDHCNAGNTQYITYVTGGMYAGGSGFHGSVTFYDASENIVHTYSC